MKKKNIQAFELSPNENMLPLGVFDSFPAMVHTNAPAKMQIWKYLQKSEALWLNFSVAFHHHHARIFLSFSLYLVSLSFSILVSANEFH